MKKLFLTLVIGLVFSSQVMAQSLVAKVNRTEVPVGETFLLTLDYDGGNTSETPNFNALDNDFTIYSVSNSFQSRFINGVSSQLRQWQVMLMPKSEGEISIPSLFLGNLQSDPIKINVISGSNSKNSAENTANQPRFAISGIANNKKPYVQQQIDYTITLYDTGGLQGDEPQFMDNGQNEWIIRNLKQPEVNAKIINGKSVREIKFYYALFPQKSGKLKTPEVQFNGFYLTNNRRGADEFDELFGGGLLGANFGMSEMFATRNPVVLKVKPLEIDVQPIPADYAGNWWLPATNVTLYSEWEPKNPVFKVGEAVNRTVYIKAIGVIENQLPEIGFKKVANIKQYPEKAIAQNGIENDEIVAVKKVSNVYIPETAGKMSLPEISINWFNVATQQIEKATLPTVNIEVLPGANSSTNAAPTIKQRGEEVENIAKEVKDVLAEEMPTEKTAWNIYILAIVPFLLGILISYFLFRPRKNKISLAEYKKMVIASAKDKDLRYLRDNLIAWANLNFSDEKITNLKDIVQYTNNKDFEKQLDILSAELYSKSKGDWNPQVFIEIFAKVNKAKGAKKNSSSPLPELYK